MQEKKSGCFFLNTVYISTRFYIIINYLKFLVNILH